MDRLWTMMMCMSLIVLLFVAPSQTLPSMIEAAAGSLELAIDMCAIYAIWLGMMEILDKSGLSGSLSHFLSRFTKRLFKTKDEEAIKHISLNMSANLLGLGNAATPSGIEAMKRLDDKSGKATFSMIMLVVINSTSIQLFPTTAISLRASAGSVSPSDIIFPTLVSTLFTTLLGIFIVSIIEKIKKKRKSKKACPH